LESGRGRRREGGSLLLKGKKKKGGHKVSSLARGGGEKRLKMGPPTRTIREGKGGSTRNNRHHAIFWEKGRKRGRKEKGEPPKGEERKEKTGEGVRLPLLMSWPHTKEKKKEGGGERCVSLYGL